jgi:site-specific DNA-methyltransferase (adenine-specific)
MGRDYDKIQIVTVQELIEQEKKLELPLSFEVVKTAKKKIDDSQLQMGL